MNPCGRTTDLLRSCNVCRVRLADGTQTKIRYYITDPNAPALGQETAFGHPAWEGTWQKNDDFQGPGTFSGGAQWVPNRARPGCRDYNVKGGGLEFLQGVWTPTPGDDTDCCAKRLGRGGGIVMGGGGWFEAGKGGLGVGGRALDAGTFPERLTLGGLALGGLATHEAARLGETAFGGLALGGLATHEAARLGELVAVGGLAVGGLALADRYVFTEIALGGQAVGGEVCDMCLETVTPTDPIIASVVGTALLISANSTIPYATTTKVSDAATNTAPVGTAAYHATSGTPTTGFGITRSYQGDTNGGTQRTIADTQATWTAAADGSRKGQLSQGVYDAAARRAGLITGTDGTQALHGLYGATPTARPANGSDLATWAAALVGASSLSYAASGLSGTVPTGNLPASVPLLSATGASLSAIPQWCKITLTVTSTGVITVGGLGSGTITGVVLTSVWIPASTRVCLHQIAMECTTKFQAPGISGLQIQVWDPGIVGGSALEIVSGYNNTHTLAVIGSNEFSGNFFYPGIVTNVKLLITPTGSTFAAITAGVANLWLLLSVVPT